MHSDLANSDDPLRLLENISLLMYTFNRKVLPILLYGTELCAIVNISDVDNIEIKVCKIILNAKTRTRINDIFIELRRLPIVIRKQRILMYWFKLIHNKESLVYKMYRLLRENANTITNCKNPGQCMLNFCYKNLLIYIFETQGLMYEHLFC